MADVGMAAGLPTAEEIEAEKKSSSLRQFFYVLGRFLPYVRPYWDKILLMVLRSCRCSLGLSEEPSIRKNSWTGRPSIAL